MKRVMKKAAFGAGALVLTLVSAVPASAQVVHSVQFGAGWFFPKGCDPGLANRLDCRASRGSDDVLVEDLNSLAFDMKDFRGPTLFGEWNITFDERVELSLGAGFYRRTVPSVYRDFVDIDLTEIEQDLRLRVIPVSAVVRFLPTGRAGDVQPYIGGGLAALNWKYWRPVNSSTSITTTPFSRTTSSNRARSWPRWRWPVCACRSMEMSMRSTPSFGTNGAREKRVGSITDSLRRRST